MLRTQGDLLAVEGPITMDTVRALHDAALGQLRAPETVIDLGAATDVDSSAVALLLEWRRVAQRRNIQLRVVNVPPSVTSLGDLYGVKDLLGTVG